MNNKFTAIKAIFFDTSDTLYKNDKLEAAYPKKLIELIGSTLNVPIDEAKRSLDEITEQLKATEKHVTKVRAAAEFGISRADVHEKAFCKVVPSDYLSEDTALDKAMSRLAKRYRLGIISNLKKSHMLEIFRALGLSPELFPLLVTEDTVKDIKPAAEPFLKAIELAQCRADECLYVGDSPSKDMRPAKEVGMKTILVKAEPSRDDMQYADSSVSDVKALTDFLL